MKKKSKLMFSICIISFVLIYIFVIDPFLPESLEHKITTFMPDWSTEDSVYQSDYCQIGKDSYCIMLLIDKSLEDDEDVAKICVVRKYGILKNKYEVKSSTDEITLDELQNPEYDEETVFPKSVIQGKKDYYGSVYYGIVPSRCGQIKIGENSVEVQKIKTAIGEKKIEFNLFYLLIEEDKYPNNQTIEYFYVNT